MMRSALLVRNCLTVRGSFPYNPFMKFQDVILSLQRFWADRGCVIRQPYDIEVGAGTFNPATFFRVLGPETIAMYLQGVDNVFDLVWADGMTYGDIHHRTEVEFSRYNFEEADIEMLFSLFKMYENESLSLIAKGLILPAYDYCLKTSHIFNLLDARKAISVSERTGYIARVRNLAKRCAEGYSGQP